MAAIQKPNESVAEELLAHLARRLQNKATPLSHGIGRGFDPGGIMCHRMLSALSLAGVVLVFGCAHAARTGGSPGDIGPDADSIVDATNSSIVFTGKQLWRRNTDLLTALDGRVAGMHVEATGACPAITLRGKSSMTNLSNPRIYVNGEPAANTCILESLNTADLRRVEVYPSGVSGRPGYFNDANGLILIFMKQSNEP